MIKINIAFFFFQQIGDDYATKTKKNVKEKLRFKSKLDARNG